MWFMTTATVQARGPLAAHRLEPSWTESKRAAAVRAVGAWLVPLAADPRRRCPRAARAAGVAAPWWERPYKLVAAGRSPAPWWARAAQLDPLQDVATGHHLPELDPLQDVAAWHFLPQQPAPRSSTRCRMSPPGTTCPSILRRAARPAAGCRGLAPPARASRAAQLLQCGAGGRAARTIERRRRSSGAGGRSNGAGGQCL